ncbi:DUF5691 domain-containing protein [Hymenobacter sp. GOD-10R]|uniref:DUF5691 domain-containing protein n=1 Tax=Hymenobacter sp. GOD-10R TaxID=3093922 RepID=UPI002D78152C|nr:DUF5691 domain-containing protein [Hymenobacter sp. GOD-10R]WRQ30996.1 DUF5691 domain-containing protein [Hymenobacter sp. GOD-10R]
MNPHTDWQQLLRVTLLGTRQSGEGVPSLAELPTPASREEQVLLAAGSLALVRKAGFKAPVAAPSETQLAPAETAPTLGLKGQDALRQLLMERYPALLSDYLVSVAQVGRRVPHQQLVSLLNYVRTRSELHAPAAAVLGERGSWLVRLNSEWQHVLAASEVPDSATWETGTLSQRQTYLQTIRQQDPAQARELLAVALPLEPVKTQAALLSTLIPVPTLHADDAPLLEHYLASKSKEVRQTVTPLLARTPGNTLVERLWQYALPCLELKKPLLGRKKLDVTLPAAWSPAWQADGIEQKDNRFTGEKAAWLGQFLALIPPERWTAHWDISPADLLALAATSEWASLLLPAWKYALLLHRSAAWALAYLGLQLTHDNVPPLTSFQAIATASHTEVTRLLLAHLPRHPRFTQPEARWETLLVDLPGPWPEALTHKALEIIENTLTVSNSSQQYLLIYRLTQLLRHMQLTVPPTEYAHCAKALRNLGHVDSSINTATEQFLSALYFRQQLHETLTELPAPDG